MMSQEKRQQMLERFAVDEEYFLRNVLPHHFPEPLQFFHREMLSDVESGHEFCAFKCPRGTGKTTLIQCGHLLYMIAMRRTRFCLMISDTESQAALNLETVKDEIETNEIFQFFFGHIKNPKKWSETEIETISGTKVLCKGTGQRIRGLKWGAHRPDLYLIDDFESEQNTETEELRKKVARWLMGPVIGSIKGRAQVILTGTVVHQKALLATIDQHPAWKVRHYAILTREGKSIWPSAWPKARIEQLRAMHVKMGTLDVFYREYFNEAKNPEADSLLDPGTAKFYREIDLYREKGMTFLRRNGKHPVPLSIYTGVDPALGREHSNNTALITIGVDPDWNIYIIDTVLDKIAIEDTVNMIFSVYEKARPWCIGVEDVGYQEALMILVNQGCLTRGLFPYLQGVPTKGERKQIRIMSMRPRFTAGAIYFREGHPKDIELIAQAERFDPEAKSNDDDGLDGLYIAIAIADSARPIGFIDGVPQMSTETYNKSWMSA